MKKVLTITKWLCLGLLLLLALLITGSIINHRLQTPREEAAYPPPGQMVAVNGHRLHVYAEGEGQLTAEETAVYCSIMYRRTLTADMLAEIDITQANAELVAAAGIPDVPLYLFISNGADSAVPNWVDLLVAYAEDAPNGRYQLLDVEHYVHSLAPDAIVAETRQFLQEINP
jgi:hypothetical protein